MADDYMQDRIASYEEQASVVNDHLQRMARRFEEVALAIPGDGRYGPAARRAVDELIQGYGNLGPAINSLLRNADEIDTRTVTTRVTGLNAT